MRDLETGTFITRDPLGFVDGPNLYTYVAQNPWTSFDPEGLLSDDQRAKLRENDTYSKAVINKLGDKDEAVSTPEKILNDELKTSPIGGNSGSIPFTAKWNMQHKYKGESDEDIALTESAHRNLVRAQVLLAQHGLLSKNEVTKLQLRGMATLADATIDLGMTLVPYARLVSALKPIAEISQVVATNAAVRIGQAAEIRMVAGYELAGSKMVEQGTYKVNIYGLFGAGAEDAGQGFKVLTQVLQKEASEAGARRIQIVGSHVINDQLKNPFLVQRAARMNGFNVQFSDGRIFLTAPVK